MGQPRVNYRVDRGSTLGLTVGQPRVNFRDDRGLIQGQLTGQPGINVNLGDNKGAVFSQLHKDL